MFVRRSSHNDSFSKQRPGKSSVSKSRTQRSFKEHAAATTRRAEKQSKTSKPDPPTSPSNLTSPIVTLSIGPTARLFAAHENILTTSPFFATLTRDQYLSSNTKRISLPEEVPEVFSSVLEFLYKGDYYPKIQHNKRRNAWQLEDTTAQPPASTIFLESAQQALLKDTLIYCAADRYALPELKRLALRKQGLQSGISCQTILSSARYAYANTPDSDSKLRAHYLALIIRSRATFKRSGTMQAEMERGGGLFFDLFVAMCNHMDDITNISKSPRTPRTL
ncbi:MAG: hypothetical protein Q9164_003889 [Protoblastenia rupestris]